MTYPAVTAPGVNIVTSERGGFYGSASGTSLAAPHVSGALALLRQAFPTATTTQLEAALVASAADLGTAGIDNTFGAGRVETLAGCLHLPGRRFGDPDADADRDSPADSDARTYPHTHTHTHTDADADAVADVLAHAHAHASG